MAASDYKIALRLDRIIVTVFAALVHFINFVLSPLGLAAISVFIAKCLWWTRLSWSSSWRVTLTAWGANMGMSVAGWLLTGKDGSMWAYALMVLGNTIVLWWLGFVSARLSR
jgi:hypothetical protein